MNYILTFCIAAFCAIQTISCDDPMVTVQQGPLRGKLQEAVTGGSFYSFENIPYAAPPTGSLRFKAPEEPKPWEGTRDATALGPMCPQWNPLTKILNTGSEDCLTCNVYSPDLAGKLPVIVFISGYAYFFDGDYVGLYGPDFMVKDAVVVTVQYRQDIFGFLKLDTAAVPGNAGLKDQVAALIWVRDNIANFGGDPGRVTLAGISSGSASIFHHMMSPMSTGLFHRAIMMSGVPSCDAIYPYQVREKSYIVGKEFGFETEDADEYLSLLQQVPYEKLINQSYHLATKDKNNQLFKKMSSFVIDFEGVFGQKRAVTTDFITSSGGGIVNKVPVMIGYCDKEGLIVVNEDADFLIDRYAQDEELFVPNKILYKADQYDIPSIASKIRKYYFGDKTVSTENIKEFVQCNSFSGMSYTVLRTAREISEIVDTYLFKFSSTSSRNIYGREGLKYGIEGAAHGDMVAYMFHLKPLNMTVDVNSDEYSMIKQLVSTVINFAESGRPTPIIEDWPLFTTETLKYLEFTNTTTVKERPDDEEYQFWDSTIFNNKQ